MNEPWSERAGQSSVGLVWSAGSGFRIDIHTTFAERPVSMNEIDVEAVEALAVAR